MDAALFPELTAERDRLAFARRCRDRMIERFEAVDPESAADEITKEYVEVRVAVALEDLASPGAGDFFGRIDDEHGQWYIGRRHIEDDDHEPVVVDWRAPIAAPFYRATAVDPLGVDFRRRHTLGAPSGDETAQQIVAYLDEHLDDPDAADVVGGIPDPVLAEIGAERSGEMREIVATIQGEQDVVIRSSIDQVLVVQGGPGTGKTAVALHRAAYLLFEHRARLARDGVLVVGPNRAFLDYIGNVLPSLGERSVRQTTLADLCLPRVDVTADDDTETARWKGAAERLADLENAALAAIRPPDDEIRIPIGVRTHVISVAQFTEWLATATGGTSPINQRRDRLRALAKRELLRRTGDDGAWSKAAPLKSAISKAWPNQKPVTLVDRMLPGPRGKRRMWTPADQLLVDEANSILNGTPFTFGHAIVDEAQDVSAVGLRVLGRRSPQGSVTLVGDVAQSTTPAGQQRWSDVFAHLGVRGVAEGSVADLTIGYRVPEPILSVANRLLPLTAVDATPSTSVRLVGQPPMWITAAAGSPDEFADTVVATAVDVRTRHKLTGLVAPVVLHEALVQACERADLVAVSHVHELAKNHIPLFAPEAVKGLEFDGVVVVQPHVVLHEAGDDPTPRGARLLYVAMTRAVQELTFVTDAAPPEIIAQA